jgi:hypothetical protein
MVKGSLAAGMQRVVDALLAAGDDGAQPAV